MTLRNQHDGLVQGHHSALSLRHKGGTPQIRVLLLLLNGILFGRRYALLYLLSLDVEPFDLVSRFMKLWRLPIGQADA